MTATHLAALLCAVFFGISAYLWALIYQIDRSRLSLLAGVISLAMAWSLFLCVAF